MVERRIEIGGWAIVAKGVDDTNGNGKKTKDFFYDPSTTYRLPYARLPYAIILTASSSFDF